MMFRGDYISDEKATLLAEALHNKKNTTITSIYCIRFEFSSTDGFTMFINAVCTTLQKILFTRNDFDMDLFPMDYKQVQIVSSNLKDTSCSLTRIDLSNCHMGYMGMICIMESLLYNTILENINLTNTIGPDVNGKYYNTSTAMDEATLVYDDSTNAESSILVKGLMQVATIVGTVVQNNTTLKHLDLSCNQFDDECIVPIADGLRTNKALKTLFLSENPISDDGVIALANALKYNKSLETLDMHDNVNKI